MTAHVHRFCEQCGECLICYGEDVCHVSADGQHSTPADRDEAPVQIIRDLVDLQAMGIPGWAITSSATVICSYCGALAKNVEDIAHENDCPVARAIHWLQGQN